MTINALSRTTLHSRKLGASVSVFAMSVLCLLFGASHASAAETHLFDAPLSLTGNCSTSSADPVPDPGCPGGTHPATEFASPAGEAVDAYGNLYVDSYGGAGQGTEARIDIFDSTGAFIDELPVVGAKALAVDTEGHLYVYTHPPDEREVLRYDPITYNPAAGEITYNPAPVVVISSGLAFNIDMAVDSSNNHLYVNFASHISEYGAAGEGNPLIDATIGSGHLFNSKSVAVDAVTHDVYASDTIINDLASNSVVRVFDGTTPGHPLERTIDGSTTPVGSFGSNSGQVSIAVEESSGHVFVYDHATPATKKPVYEFTETGGYVATTEHKFEYFIVAGIAIDNGVNSPNKGELFVPSGEGGDDHVFAFRLKPEPKPPVVEAQSFAGITEGEAELRAKVNPNGLATHYRFEYTTEQSFEEEGFLGALLAGEGDLAAGTEGVDVVAGASGLSSATTYRVRVLAENACEPGGCIDESQAAFTTFGGVVSPGGNCENKALRTGASAALPDCRAYELVTPTNTNGRAPVAPNNNFAGPHFGTPPASPRGDSLAFLIVGGALPGYPGAGSFNGDTYVGTRTASGWQTASAGPSGTLSSNPVPGGLSPDHSYAAGSTGPEDIGSLTMNGEQNNYLRHPDGSFHLTGEGSLGMDPQMPPKFITAGGTHTIFAPTEYSDRIQLEPEAPPTGTAAIYDRTADEIVHVVSLLPGDVTPAAGQNAFFAGASGDGSVVAFGIGNTLYERFGNSKTVELASAATFAGISGDGERTFYLKGGNLFAYDSAGEESTQITPSGDVAVVNVATEGTGAYFVSSAVLTGAPNPQGDEAQLGGENLYLWDGSTHFVATLTERDVAGKAGQDGLGLWAQHQADGTTAFDPSRTSSDGMTLVFQSRANLTGYESGGPAEIYRYDATENSLDCLSCSPTHTPATGDSKLQSVSTAVGVEPTNGYAQIPNLSADGKRAFFESPDALVKTDTDSVLDVYEWEASGTGSCTTAPGCVYLISTGHSARDNYLFGISASGNDVFIYTSDLLLESDPDETPSVYDARVKGGIAPPATPPGECLGEACQPVAVALNDPTPASSTFEGSGNVKPEAKPKARCPKGKKMRGKAGKSRCVASHPKKKSHKRTKTNRRAAR